MALEQRTGYLPAQERGFHPAWWQSLVLVAAWWTASFLASLLQFVLTGWKYDWEASRATGPVTVVVAGLFVLWLGKNLTGKAWRQIVPIAPPGIASVPPFILAQVALSLAAGALAVLALSLDDVAGASAAGAAGARLVKFGPGERSDFWGAGLASVVEEPIFRGLILSGFLARYSRGRAILLNGLVFAVAHLHWGQFVLPLAMGIFWAWVAAETRSIVLPLLGHTLHNLAGTALVRLDAPGRAFVGEWAPTALCATSVVSVGALLLLRRALRQANPQR